MNEMKKKSSPFFSWYSLGIAHQRFSFPPPTQNHTQQQLKWRAKKQQIPGERKEKNRTEK